MVVLTGFRSDGAVIELAESLLLVQVYSPHNSATFARRFFDNIIIFFVEVIRLFVFINRSFFYIYVFFLQIYTTVG